MVSKVQNRNIDNRLSPLQRQILDYLAHVGQPIGDRIGHLPRTGDVVDAVGRPRDKGNFASVSRALRRLCAAGLVNAYVPALRTRGKGLHWSLSDG